MTAIGDSTPTKTCTKCGEGKLATSDFFCRRAALREGLTAHCKECAKSAKAAYYAEHRERIKAAANAYYNDNREAAKARVVSRYHANKEEIRARVSEYRAANPETVKATRAKSYLANKPKALARAAEYYKKNKDKLQETQAQWRAENKWRVRGYGKAYAEKIKADPVKVMQARYRSIVSKAWRGMGYTKESKSGEILGCSWEEFKAHIERQFVGGMCWERIAEIHLDHVVPLSSAKTEEDVRALNHYTNLRPLWAKDNLSKGAEVRYLL